MLKYINETVDIKAKNIACGAHLILTSCFKYLLSIKPSTPSEKNVTDASPMKAAINIAKFSKPREIDLHPPRRSQSVVR